MKDSFYSLIKENVDAGMSYKEFAENFGYQESYVFDVITLRQKNLPENIHEIIEEVIGGASYNAVGKKHGYSMADIRRWCLKYGVKSEQKSYSDRQRIKDEDVKTIVDLVYEGMSYYSIAKSFGMSEYAILHAIKRSEYGIDLFPLNGLEKQIFKRAGTMSDKAIAKKLNISLNYVRQIASERNVSLRYERRLWSEFETAELLKLVQNRKQERIPYEAFALSVNRSVDTVKTMSTKLIAGLSD